jgi:hypothetical protein
MNQLVVQQRRLWTLASILLASPFSGLPLAAQGSAPLASVRETRLEPQSSASFDNFALALALGPDLALVGSPGASSLNGSLVGAAYLFERQPQGWVEVAELRASDGAAGDRFGSAVALDGARLAVGATGADANAMGSGAVYVFERGATGWSETVKLVGVGADVGEALGWSLALEGDTLIAGAADDHHSGGSFDGGAAYHYAFAGGAWTQLQRLIPGDGMAFDYFSRSLALDGDTLVVGAYSDNHMNAANGGSAYVFRRGATGAFALAQKLIPADNGSNDLFGWSVALLGGELVVGAPGDTLSGAFEAGSAYVFADTPTGFAFVEKLLSPDLQAGARFGSSAALGGGALIVGASQAHSPVGQFTGNAYLFERSAAGFVFNAPLRSTALELGADFGFAAATDGERVLIGAPGDDTRLAGQNAGAAYVYRLTPEAETYCTAKVNGLGCTPAIHFAGRPSVSATAPFTIGATNVLNQRSGLLVYGYASAATPFQGGVLCIAPPLIRTSPQTSGGSASGADCSGAYGLDFGALLASGVDPELFVGAEGFAQYWSRDPFSVPAIGLTDAVRFLVRP